MSFTLQLSSFTRKQLARRLKEAYANGALKRYRMPLASHLSAQEAADAQYDRESDPLNPLLVVIVPDVGSQLLRFGYP